jgi:hypothetical protein
VTAPVLTAPTPATIRDETARIARVRSLLDGGNASEAAAELDRYVATYPKGFFAADVTRLRSEIAAKR